MEKNEEKYNKNKTAIAQRQKVDDIYVTIALRDKLASGQRESRRLY